MRYEILFCITSVTLILIDHLRNGYWLFKLMTCIFCFFIHGILLIEILKLEASEKKIVGDILMFIFAADRLVIGQDG